jgi:hypothetical protein
MLDPFYAKLKEQSFLDKSTGKETELVAEGHDLLVANLFDLQLSKGLGHFYRRFSVDINGLVVAFGVVVALIALAKGILYLP